MSAYFRYLKAVLRHKWFVFVECSRRGHPLMGLLHDMSKFRPSEFLPYANFFYGREAKPGDEAFDFAWLLHQKRNKHHWQWWVLPEDEGGTKLIPMSDKHRVEMVCDWRGAGRAYGNNDTPGWYMANKHKLRLDPGTRAWVEADLGISQV